MAAFDRDAWLRRAKKRLEKALERGKERAEADYANDRYYINQLRVVVEWAQQRGLTVNFTRNVADSGGGMLHPDTREIEISSCCLPESQVYTFLHEAGHFLVQGGSTPRKSYRKRYGNGYPRTLEDGIEKNLEHRLAILDEEFEAWHRGLSLAERLKVRVNKKKWSSDRKQMLNSYVGWVSRPGDYTKG